jgi:Mannose-6-phosphate isomerase
LIGVDDLAVVVSDDAILVTKRGHSENVKILVAELQARKIKEAD